MSTIAQPAPHPSAAARSATPSRKQRWSGIKMLDLCSLIEKYASVVPLEVKNHLGEHLAISASVFVFSPANLWDMTNEMRTQLEDEIFETLRSKRNA
jgi:hypothetical protein